MYKRLNDLSFVIGLFFVLVSIILLINGFMSPAANNKLTFFSATGFLIFGVFMVFTKTK